MPWWVPKTRQRNSSRPTGPATKRWSTRLRGRESIGVERMGNAPRGQAAGGTVPWGLHGRTEPGPVIRRRPGGSPDQARHCLPKRWLSGTIRISHIVALPDHQLEDVAHHEEEENGEDDSGFHEVPFLAYGQECSALDEALATAFTPGLARLLSMGV